MPPLQVCRWTRAEDKSFLCQTSGQTNGRQGSSHFPQAFVARSRDVIRWGDDAAYKRSGEGPLGTGWFRPQTRPRSRPWQNFLGRRQRTRNRLPARVQVEALVHGCIPHARQRTGKLGLDGLAALLGRLERASLHPRERQRFARLYVGASFDASTSRKRPRRVRSPSLLSEDSRDVSGAALPGGGQGRRRNGGGTELWTAHVFERARGIVNENVVPFPNALSTQIFPPCASTIPFAMARPSPRPSCRCSRPCQ